MSTSTAQKVYDSKKIGNDYISKVPTHWEVMPLKWVLDCPVTDGPHLTPEFIDDGIPFISVDGIQDGELTFEECRYISKEDHIEFKKKAAPLIDDILMGKAASTGKIARVKVDFEFSIWSPLALIRVNSNRCFPSYVEYVLKSPELQAQIDNLCTHNTQKNISMGDIPKLVISVPPISEQKSIAFFLDQETTRLDTLINEKNNLVNLLAEKRRTLITSAVTRGIDPKVKLKDTGFSWLGEIPKHWDIERSKWLFKERDIRSEFGDEEMLTVSHITGVTTRAEKNVNMFLAESQEGSKICEAGDLVINTLWAWMGAMGVSPQRGIVSPAYNVYAPGGKLDPAYVDYLVRMPIFAQEAIRFSKGVWSSRLRLYPEGLYEIWFPVPPIEEQRAIAEYLAVETKKIDALQEATDRTIALLRERRTALIAAAVTGKIAIPSEIKKEGN